MLLGEMLAFILAKLAYILAHITSLDKLVILIRHYLLFCNYILLSLSSCAILTDYCELQRQLLHWHSLGLFYSAVATLLATLAAT